MSKRAALRCFQIDHAVRAMRELRPFRKLGRDASRVADHQGKKLASSLGRSIGRRHQDRISCQVIFEKVHWTSRCMIDGLVLLAT